MKSISLAKKNKGDSAGTMCTPSDWDGCPTVYLSGDKELAAIPAEGTITFKFERSSVTLADGKTPVRMELKLLSIEAAKEEDVSDAEPDEDGDDESDEKDTGAAIDKLLSSLQDEVEE